MSAIFALAMSASAPLSGALIQCNTVDADGVAKPYLIDIVIGDNVAVTMNEVGRFSTIPLEVSNVVLGPAGTVSFTVYTGKENLAATIWDGFSRKFSQIDGKHVQGTFKGLTFLTGICTDQKNFSPVTHKFQEERYPAIKNKKVQRCFGVTLDGRHFSSILDTVSKTHAEFSTQGLGKGKEFDKARLAISGFPAFPEKPGYQSYWAYFGGKKGEGKPSIISEARVNVIESRGSKVLDFQTLDGVEEPLMVARAHCGLFPVEFGSD